MNLSDYRTRLQDLAGNDLAGSDSYYNRLINDAYLELAALFDWWWLETHELLRFDAPVTTKNFTASMGSQLLTPCTTADYATTAYCYGFAATGNHTYRIDSVSGANVSLDSEFMEATGTYAIAIWNDMLPVASACDRPIALIPRNDPNTKPLRLVDLREIEAYGPDISDHAQEIANVYSVFREPLYRSVRMLLRIFPPPDEISEYVFRYKQTPTTMADDTATTFIPPKFEQCLVSAILLKYLKLGREDRDLIPSFELEFQKNLGAMRAAQSRSSSIIRRVGRRDGIECEPLRFKITNATAGGI